MQSMQRCSKLSTPQHSTASRTTVTVLCTTLSVSHVVVEEFWPHPSLQNCVSSLRFDYIWLRHSFKHSSLKINSILIRLSSRLWLDLYDMLILFSFSHSKLYCQKEEEFVLMCRVWFFPKHGRCTLWPNISTYSHKFCFNNQQLPEIKARNSVWNMNTFQIFHIYRMVFWVMSSFKV